MGYLRRNLALAPRHTKEVAYKTLVRPQLEYAAPLWHPIMKMRQKCGESAEDSSQVDLQAMAEQDMLTICWTNSSDHHWRTAGRSPP